VCVRGQARVAQSNTSPLGRCEGLQEVSWSCSLVTLCGSSSSSSSSNACAACGGLVPARTTSHVHSCCLAAGWLRLARLRQQHVLLCSRFASAGLLLLLLLLYGWVSYASFESRHRASCQLGLSCVVLMNPTIPLCVAGVCGLWCRGSWLLDCCRIGHAPELWLDYNDRAIACLHNPSLVTMNACAVSAVAALASRVCVEHAAGGS
jgi:hypothetical protein